MTTDDILFAPLRPWRLLCQDIARWIDYHRNTQRTALPLDRPRPPGALLLEDMLEAFHCCGQKVFWRTEYPHVLYPWTFEFDGVVKEALPGTKIHFPVFGEIGHHYYRSIEDVNLVANDYSHFFIFENMRAAIDGLSFLSFNYL